MPDVNIKVKNKIAVGDGTVIVCGNTDYTAVFDFDVEWDEYETKTARFISNGEYTDIVFTGNKCAIPAQQNTHGVQVGVFAGDLHTTTPAYFDCAKSILCDGGAPADPAPDVYDQLMEKLNGLEGVSAEQLAEAVAGYLAENPVAGAVKSVNGKTGAVELTASDVGALGGTSVYYFDGPSGNNLQYILTNFNCGTITSDSAGLSRDIATPAFVMVNAWSHGTRVFAVIDSEGKFYRGLYYASTGEFTLERQSTYAPNPEPLTITIGDTTYTYDGTQAVSITIDSASGVNF